MALFERKARGIEPTEAAHDLALQVSTPLDVLEQKLAGLMLFDRLRFKLRLANQAERIIKQT
ncbi:hypothetical protein HaloA020_21830 [Halomonas sp. A020]|nr:hypothetical protein HaloA020_21830 [Halomonas sp. A020]